ncbi:MULTISPECIES: SAM-dependent methyltransferase [unclassified Streptomyces]|uniref:SAM-dependent methyltransferase n=1 Tax=unclassified Streptomyces TaxID=2593676 RepID=UPI0006F84F50|nr:MULTISPECIES: SAM-dependent methyltransferase [unclassified Streptomyces]KQX47716.1 translation initiation factor IF-2 [Streptomyces sp. Root1304]KRA94928.1 translation initiation factor IF-2 [Streptomyces sp. Root66D1]
MNDRIRTDIAHNARVWNYWLGGKDNYPVDRAVGDQVTGFYPSIGEVARADRAFLGRVVTGLAADAGVRQFLDIGTGLPTADNTHEVAQRVLPDARIVYVDNDPIVLTHARALLTSAPEGVTEYVDADAREPGKILAAAGATLDLTRPVAVMMLGILNFVLDTDETRTIVRTLMDAVPSGSYLVLTHPTLEPELGGEGNKDAMAFWNENATPPITARSRAEFTSFFEGLELLEPGVVSCSRWRPTAEEAPVVAQFGAVGRKP